MHQDKQIDLTILPGAEVEDRPNLAGLLKDDELLTVADNGRHLLIETPFVGIPQFLEQMCFELQIIGITPILAHPERSELARRCPEILEKLVDRGCLLQINVASVLGQSGRESRRLALRLLQTGQAHILASDAHDANFRPPQLSLVRKELERMVKNIDFQMLVDGIPRSIIA